MVGLSKILSAKPKMNRIELPRKKERISINKKYKLYYKFWISTNLFEFVYTCVFSFFSKLDGKCIYKLCYKFCKRYYKKLVTHTIPACYSCKISACCMQQNNKPEFQRNIKLEFSQTYHNFNQSLRNMGNYQSLRNMQFNTATKWRKV